MKKVLTIISLILLPVTLAIIVYKKAKEFNNILVEIEYPYKKEPAKHDPILDWIDCKLQLSALSYDEKTFLQLVKQKAKTDGLSKEALYWIKRDFETIESLDAFHPNRRDFFLNWIKAYEQK